MLTVSPHPATAHIPVAPTARPVEFLPRWAGRFPVRPVLTGAAVFTLGLLAGPAIRLGVALTIQAAG